MTADAITITKLDAACRELRTAIELWFNDRDPVSIHLLAFSSYEILHKLATIKKGAKNLLYHSHLPTEEMQREANIALKKAANFFKHADRDIDASIEFRPQISEGFIQFCIIALQDYGASLGDEEFAFSQWCAIHRPDELTLEGRKFFIDDIEIEQLGHLRNLSKGEFFKIAMDAKRLAREGGFIP